MMAMTRTAFCLLYGAAIILGLAAPTKPNIVILYIDDCA